MVFKSPSKLVSQHKFVNPNTVLEFE